MDAIDKDFSDGGAIDSSTMIPAIIEIFQNYNGSQIYVVLTQNLIKWKKIKN